jgi:hypothetical protein
VAQPFISESDGPDRVEDPAEDTAMTCTSTSERRDTAAAPFPGDPELSFDRTRYSTADAPRQKPCCKPSCKSEGSKQACGVRWVEICADDHMISRNIEYESGHDPQSQYERFIWPAWPTTSRDEVDAADLPLARMQEYCGGVGSRLRDSAKWMATVLGAALAAVVGTSPLAGMRDHRPQGIAIILGSIGLVFFGITMLLVIQVMRPKLVSFADVENPKRLEGALRKWQETVEGQADLYLPCAITSLAGLRESMTVEEYTLMALAHAKATAHNARTAQWLCEAQAARAARLRDLRAAASRIASIGEYYALHRRSSWATYCGIVCGLLATAAIVTAFVWPPS